jgi:hypothetical protein
MLAFKIHGYILKCRLDCGVYSGKCKTRLWVAIDLNGVDFQGVCFSHHPHPWVWKIYRIHFQFDQRRDEKRLGGVFLSALYPILRHKTDNMLTDSFYSPQLDSAIVNKRSGMTGRKIPNEVKWGFKFFQQSLVYSC